MAKTQKQGVGISFPSSPLLEKEQGKPLTVDLYIRVSTFSQLEGDSLEEQESELRKFCDYRGFRIHRIYCEEAKSGGNTKRPQIWDTLLYYESYDLIKAKYLSLHRRTPNAQNIKEISSSFIQAREYFSSASISDRAVKPLLLYYGVTSLCRGTTLLLTPLRETALSNTHGLEINDWKKVLSKLQPDIAELKIKICPKGAFPEFIHAIKNIGLIRLGSTAITNIHSHKPLGDDAKLTLGDIVSRVPDLRMHYIRWKPSPRSCVVLDIKMNAPENSTQITILKNNFSVQINRDDVTNIFRTISHEIIVDDTENIILKIPTTEIKPNGPLVWDAVNKNYLGIGQAYFVEHFEHCDLSKCAAIYILSYTLGMLARYFPSQWMSLIRNEQGDGALPTVLKSLSYIEETFPNMIVDLLETDTSNLTSI